MSSSDSYYSDSYEYEFNPYDSDSWPEPILEDESQMFHRDQLRQSQFTPPTPPVPEAVIPDNSIAVCHTLDQSKELIQATTGVNPSSLRSSSISGIVIIPIKDINLIRKDHRSNRNLPNILVLPVGEDFQLRHPDFAYAIQTLNQ